MAKVQWILTTVCLLYASSLSKSDPLDSTKIYEHTKETTSLPDHEVIPLLHKNDSEQNRESTPLPVKEKPFSVSLEKLQLYLEPNDHVLLGEDTPVYLASGDESQPHGIRYERVENAWPKNSRVYQDFVNNAAVKMFKTPDKGTDGNDTMIKNFTLQNRNILIKNISTKNSLSPKNYFIKSYWSGKPRKTSVDAALEFSATLYNEPKPLWPTKIVENPEVVYPEILVIVDYETYLAHGKSLQALTRYMAVFWNAVDLRFRGIWNSKVRLNIAAMIVAIDEGGAPYIAKHKNLPRSSEILSDLGKYLNRQNRFEKKTYDLTIAITSLDLCAVRPKIARDVCNTKIHSMSYYGGVCQHDHEYKGELSDVARGVVEDHADFDGVLAAAREIAYLLGSDRDYFNGFHTYKGSCGWNEGYLMGGYRRSSSNALLLSDCSVEQIRDFMWRGNTECLRNKPEVKRPITKMLPGQLMSRDEQCRIRHGMVACQGEPGKSYECRRLYCRPIADDKCVSTEPPVEGTPCSDGGVCLDGVCVHEKEEEMAKKND